MEKEVNFDIYLETQLKTPVFAGPFRKAGEAWDVAVQLAALRKASGMSQKGPAKRVWEHPSSKSAVLNHHPMKAIP